MSLCSLDRADRLVLCRSVCILVSLLYQTNPEFPNHLQEKQTYHQKASERTVRKNHSGLLVLVACVILVVQSGSVHFRGNLEICGHKRTTKNRLWSRALLLSNQLVSNHFYLFFDVTKTVHQLNFTAFLTFWMFTAQISKCQPHGSTGAKVRWSPQVVGLSECQFILPSSQSLYKSNSPAHACLWF